MQNLTIIILIVVAAIAMFVGGWVTFADVGQEATITIHKEEMKKDTESAIRKGEELIEDAAREGRELIDEAEESIDDSDAIESTGPDSKTTP